PVPRTLPLSPSFPTRRSSDLDPATLPLVDIARLYARRWDIELAFRELKEHLKMRLLWSAKLGVIYQQIWASLILAQLLHAYQVEDRKSTRLNSSHEWTSYAVF